MSCPLWGNEKGAFKRRLLWHQLLIADSLFYIPPAISSTWPLT